MFFALTNAIFDAGIAGWDAKRDSVRPVTAIPFLFHGQPVNYWGGPGKGTVYADGANWIPCQPSTIPSPAFPEFFSGHSTFSAAGATILTLWTGSTYFGDSVRRPYRALHRKFGSVSGLDKSAALFQSRRSLILRKNASPCSPNVSPGGRRETR
jgi:hypothetical protein